MVRDSSGQSIAVADLVPGDLVEVRLGQLVPADLRRHLSDADRSRQALLLPNTETCCASTHPDSGSSGTPSGGPLQHRPSMILHDRRAPRARAQQAVASYRSSTSSSARRGVHGSATAPACAQPILRTACG
ncbi:hypothetical protein [Nocardia sp. NPDC049149]|uniref:hypothetical protein n=1 Tax=Nocardia sp. NPDC049149 TaxID=3364315 RepID=UPI0037212FBC